MNDDILKNVTQDNLDDIAINLNKNYELGGNRMRFAALNLFCKKILKRPDLYLKIPVSRKKNKDILTHQQVDKLLQIVKTKRYDVYVVFLTIYHCALRRSEVCNLNIEDVNFERKDIFIEIGDHAKAVWEMFLDMKSINDPIARKNKFLEFRKDFYDYVISVPSKYVVEKEFEDFGFIYISNYQVEHCYDINIGWNRTTDNYQSYIF